VSTCCGQFITLHYVSYYSAGRASVRASVQVIKQLAVQSASYKVRETLTRTHTVPLYVRHCHPPCNVVRVPSMTAWTTSRQPARVSLQYSVIHRCYKLTVVVASEICACYHALCDVTKYDVQGAQRTIERQTAASCVWRVHHDTQAKLSPDSYSTS